MVAICVPCLHPNCYTGIRPFVAKRYAMINIPPPPSLYLVSQIKCISCNHIIPLSEERERPKGSDRKSKSAKWQVHPVLQRAREKNGTSPHIVCERCGAENDNWVRISQIPYHTLWWRYVQKYHIIWQIAGLILLSLALPVIIFDPARLGDILFLTLSLLTAAVLPFWIMPQRWQKIRKNNYLKKVAPDLAAQFVFWAKPLLLTFGIVTAVPLFVYVILPQFARFTLQLDSLDRTLGKTAVIWLVLVSTILSLAMLLAANMVNLIVAEMDNYLPQPTFYHISSLIKAAKWDVERALRARNRHKELEVTKVERNACGGINFAGILYDSRALLCDNGQDAELPRQFLAETDRWGYITKGNIVGYCAEPLKENQPAEQPVFTQNGPATVQIRPFDY